MKSEISNLNSQIAVLIPRCESISRQIRGWADSLQNTDVRGQRHLSDATRTAWHQDRRTKEFLEKLDRIRASGKPSPGPADPSEV